MKREPKNENDVKELVKDWFKARKGWHFAPIQNGLGVHGIHDRLGCIPVVVTQEMVGKTVGLFVSVEAKAPGRRGEPRRGMSSHQNDNLVDILAASGLTTCCDGVGDLEQLSAQIDTLTNEYHLFIPGSPNG